MAPNHTKRLVLAFTILCACALPARAENLQRLTVQSLTLSADTASPRVEVPFHLIITARVREPVAQLDNVDLPILAELELLGDEHRVVAGRAGTTYQETIAVVAHHSGMISIAPVTLDAIDARDGRAKRYSSNALTLNVAGGLSAVPGAEQSNARNNQWVPIAVAFAAAYVVWLLLGRRRRAPVVVSGPAVTLPPPIPVTPDPRRRAREWYETLRANPTRDGAMSVRSAVRRAVGANDTQTLTDVLARPLAQTPAMRSVLRALERAGFTSDSDVSAAVQSALAALEELAR